jgi:hypothetical protein
MLTEVLHCCDFLKCPHDLSLAVARHAAQVFDGAAVQDDPENFSGFCDRFTGCRGEMPGGR